MEVKQATIKAALIMNDMTQTQLAERSAVCRQTINRICSGRPCRHGTIEKIADALGVPVDKLVKKGR